MNPAPETSPRHARSEYEVRLEHGRAAATLWRRRERWVSNLRLAVFGVGLAVAWLSFGIHSLSALWLAPVGLVFLVLVVAHDGAISRRSRAERRADLYQRGLARLDGCWAGAGAAGERFRDPGHPYAEDLDLFGRGSVFELLCTARTAAGESALASWLLEPAGADEVRARQAAVAELRGRVDLREDLGLLGETVGCAFDPEAAMTWGERPVPGATPGLRIAAAVLASASATALTAWLAGAAGPLPLLAALAVQMVLAARLRARVRRAIQGVEGPIRDLRLLADLLQRLEVEPVTCPRLARLRQTWVSQGTPASQQLARLQRLVDLLDARRNQLFAPLAALLLWTSQLGLAVEDWRRHCGPELRSWLGAAGEFEALAAIAGHAYENPSDATPELVESGPLFDATALGHILLPSSRCVRNDLYLGPDRRARVVSGSNMSGKSTLLRSAGVCAVLALAGAPVRARRLRLSPLAVAASLRVNDSIQEGVSRFYAEILRLRQIVELAEGERPVLFLLDEILHGTNSHDRRVGADAVVRGLLDRGALGLVTTHDLALARIADELSPQVENVHFEDRLEDGEVHFDYRLRPGVVHRSNALELMRAVGLEV